MRTPKWLTPKRRTKAHHATPVLLLSDLHLDERVDLYEMDGINEYDRAIANVRLERIVNATVDLLHTYVAGVHYDGIVVAILGDVLTGIIHDELERTNEHRRAHLLCIGCRSSALRCATRRRVGPRVRALR